jgi:multisubunit Na+/H+ antiporter MnhC subunit
MKKYAIRILLGICVILSAIASYIFLKATIYRTWLSAYHSYDAEKAEAFVYPWLGLFIVSIILFISFVTLGIILWRKNKAHNHSVQMNADQR